MLTVDRTTRLGCSKQGISELRSHPFFRDVDFDAIMNKRVRAPFLPPVMHAYDMQCFRETASPAEPFIDVTALPDTAKYLAICAKIDARDFPDFDCVLFEPTDV